MSTVPMTNDGGYSNISIGCKQSSMDAQPTRQTSCELPTPQSINPAPEQESGIVCNHSELGSESSQPQPTPDANEASSSPSVEESNVSQTVNGSTPTNRSIHTGEKANGSFVKAKDAKEVQSIVGPFHRIEEVRNQQGVSVRSMARRMGIDIKSYRKLEDPSRDLTLSELAAIQQALEVPIGDLLEERQGLSRPVEERAKLVKTMKTAVAIREAKSGPRVSRLAEMLCEQLEDLMPELKEVSGWPQFGARRGTNALGRALSQQIDMSSIQNDSS
ncbi:MAG: helix-turn-helix transcriptional regulator [Planctomycetota bacterium]